MGTLEVRLILVLSLFRETSLPKLPVLPPTFTLSSKYFSKSAQFIMPSSTGWVQSSTSLIWFFLPSFLTALAFPFRDCLPGLLAAAFPIFLTKLFDGLSLSLQRLLAWLISCSLSHFSSLKEVIQAKLREEKWERLQPFPFFFS